MRLIITAMKVAAGGLPTEPAAWPGRGSRTRWGINEPHSHPWTAGDSWGVALSPQSGSHQKAASVGVTVSGERVRKGGPG